MKTSNYAVGRSERQLRVAYKEYAEVIWLEQELDWLALVSTGKDPNSAFQAKSHPKVIERLKNSGMDLFKYYWEPNDFHKGYVEGKFAAIRWMLGGSWNCGNISDLVVSKFKPQSPIQLQTRRSILYELTKCHTFAWYWRSQSFFDANRNLRSDCSFGEETAEDRLAKMKMVEERYGNELIAYSAYEDGAVDGKTDCFNWYLGDPWVSYEE